MMYVRAYDRERVAGQMYDGEAEIETEMELLLQLSVYWKRKNLPLVVISHKPSGAKRRTFAMRRKEA